MSSCTIRCQTGLALHVAFQVGYGIIELWRGPRCFAFRSVHGSRYSTLTLIYQIQELSSTYPVLWGASEDADPEYTDNRIASTIDKSGIRLGISR